MVRGMQMRVKTVKRKVRTNEEVPGEECPARDCLSWKTLDLHRQRYQDDFAEMLNHNTCQ